MTTLDCNCGDCRNYPRYRPEHAGILPDDGERLTFGVHRLPATKRRTAAWPTQAEIEGRREAAYERALNRLRAGNV